jgi:hypothetical protein
LKTTVVTGGVASFSVQLGTSSTPQSLAIQYPSTTTCNITRTVTVSCSANQPTCAISQPVISATHPALNGVAAPAGDRVSSTGSSYQATFKVQTSAEDGQPVTLAVDNQLSPTAVTTLNATASGGVATFTPTLTQGNWEAVATCTNKNGISSTSTKGTFPVDIVPPDLTVNSPSSGQFVVGANVAVCGQTPSADAAGLSASLGAAEQNNLCVTVGSAATPKCVAVAAVNTSTCVNIPCPGAAAFNVTVTLDDAAGNPTSQTITGVTCVSTLPSVQIIAPVSDAPTFSDKTKHILAANAPVGVKDLDANTPGAQVNVVACTDVVGTGVLNVGQQGGALAQLGGSVATAVAAAGDNCPAGLPNVLKFSGVTLPESTEHADGSLSAATELTVTVTSAVNVQAIGTSQPDDVWVDTIPPAVAVSSPVGLCGSFIQSSNTVTEDLGFTADDKIAVLDVTNGSVTTTYDTPAYMNGVATFPGIALTQGLNDITVTASDPAGNATLMLPNPCTVTIGMAPVVTFTTPTAGAILCPAGATTTGCIPDNDAGTAGWQGSLAVSVTVGTGPAPGTDAVTFSIGGNTLGSANLDGTGHAQLNGVTIPEGVQTIVATTASLASAGVGTGNVTVTVDTTPPATPTGLNVSVVDRRKTSMQLTWTAPADGGGGNVAGYQIRYAKVPIDSTNFDNAAVTTAVPYTGSPANAGQADRITVSDLYIENGYYFAVKAVDVAGSLSSILATSSGGTCDCTASNCCAAHFTETVIDSPAGGAEVFGASSDGSGDVNGDVYADILVGTSNHFRAYLFLGAQNFSSSTPSVTFSSATDALFGTGVAQIGDIDGDGLGDIAIADLTVGSIYIYKGRQTWPLSLTDTQADYVVSSTGMWTAGSPGTSIARLGDFDGDGVDDFAVGAPVYNGRTGRIAVIYGSKTFTSFQLPDTTRALEIGGDPALNRTQFGLRVLGLGHFYSVTTGTTLVVSAPGLGAASSTSSNEGRLYAFHGRPVGAPIDATSADNVLVGPGKGAEIGQVIMNLGPLSGGNTLGSGNALDTLTVPGANGTAFVLSGTSATGVFASNTVMYVPSATHAGQMLFGGGISGRDAAFSLIGSSAVDVAMVGVGGTVDIIDGAALTNVTSPLNADQVAAVRLPLPSGWTSTTAAGGGLIPDINHDGYPDFVLGDTTGLTQGRIVVFW